MEKRTIELQGVDYAVRTLDVRAIPTFEGDAYQQMDVAGEGLWDAVERAIKAGDYDAAKIDDLIFFYVPDEMLARDASDEEIVDYMRENLCGMAKFAPVSVPEALDFYTIETDGAGEKRIRFLGFTYKGDNWKTIDIGRAESIPLSVFVDGMREHEDFVNSLYQEFREFERDVTDCECVATINTFFDGKPADYRLQFGNVTMETPNGKYVNS